MSGGIDEYDFSTHNEPHERTMPQSLDSERAVIGTLMLQADALDDVASVLQPSHFYRKAHGAIYAQILALGKARVAVDFLTLKDALAKTGELDEIGGPAYLASMVDGIPKRSNVVDYARIVRDKANLRAVVHAATSMMNRALDASDDAADVVDAAEQEIFAIAQGTEPAGFRSIGEIMPEALEQIELWHSSKRGISGVASGFDDLDAMTRGFQPGNLIVVGARPSMGKSAFVQNIAAHVTTLEHGGGVVGMFSLEMSEIDLVVRTIAGEARIDGHRLQRGYTGGSDWVKLSGAIERLSSRKFFIDQSPYVTVFEMRARARRLKAQHGLDLLIIDYTQLMVSEKRDRSENRTLELGAISRALKGLARELEIPVIALSQLSRQVESRNDKRPMLSDLRESGALEQDADVVLFIYRDEAYREDPSNKGIAEIIIGKQRNGPIGTVKLAWIAEQTRFANLEAFDQVDQQQLPTGDR